MDKKVTVMEKSRELEELMFRSLFADTTGKYRWIYEMPMLKSFFLLFEVWKVLAVAALAVMCLMGILNLFEGGGLQGMLFALEMGRLVFGIMLVLSIPAYYIVTKANNDKYTVLFEMDDSGIDHIQITELPRQPEFYQLPAVRCIPVSPVLKGSGLIQRST